MQQSSQALIHSLFLSPTHSTFWGLKQQTWESFSSLACHLFLSSHFLPLLPSTSHLFLLYTLVVVSLTPSPTAPSPSHPAAQSLLPLPAASVHCGQVQPLSGVTASWRFLVVWQKRMVAVSHGWMLKLCISAPEWDARGGRAVKQDKNKQRAKKGEEEVRI